MEPRKSVKIGIVQMACNKNKQQNIDKSISQIEKLALEGAQIICLQELFASLYFCDIEDYENFNLAEEIPDGQTTQILIDAAKRLNIVVIASLFEKRAEGLYHNTAIVIDADGTYLGKYRKMHIPDDPGYYEKFYFTPGDLGYKVFKTKYAKVGVLVCWDQWYPEAARLTALQGAEILFYPTAIGWSMDQNEEVNTEQFNAWQTIQKSHAIANGIPVVSVNRIGVEGGMNFWGGSFISNPFGSVIFQAGHTEEISNIVDINLNESNHYRTHWPFLRDRRIESYKDLEKRFID